MQKKQRLEKINIGMFFIFLRAIVFSKMSRFLRWLTVGIVTFLVVTGCNNIQTSSTLTATTQTQPVTLTVSAAADLNYAFQEIGQLWQQETGNTVVFNFGSTGQLAQQIERGAPVDVFAAANKIYIEELEKKALIIPETKAIYGRGRITIWTKQDSQLKIQDIKDLMQPAVKRVAIANPNHAPYGVAAREALQSAGIWNTVQSKLILGENVRQTQQYAETGNVDVAIVALSLSVNKLGRWELIAQEQHQSLDQMLAVVKSTKHEAHARQFAAFINNVTGRQIMRKYGFVLPGEEPI